MSSESILRASAACARICPGARRRSSKSPPSSSRQPAQRNGRAWSAWPVSRIVVDQRDGLIRSASPSGARSSHVASIGAWLGVHSR